FSLTSLPNVWSCPRTDQCFLMIFSICLLNTPYSVTKGILLSLLVNFFSFNSFNLFRDSTSSLNSHGDTFTKLE
ncbi:hypothetical protein XELAEV_18033479mg, partial [Xenopus laevis]